MGTDIIQQHACTANDDKTHHLSQNKIIVITVIIGEEVCIPKIHSHDQYNLEQVLVLVSSSCLLSILIKVALGDILYMYTTYIF